MSSANRKRNSRIGSELTKLLLELPSGRRPAIANSIARCLPQQTLANSFDAGIIQLEFANLWEELFREPIPISDLRKALEPPQAIRIAMEFGKLALEDKPKGLKTALIELFEFLFEIVEKQRNASQRPLFGDLVLKKQLPIGQSVDNLQALIDQGKRFPTIYADPPWRYRNKSSRGAAENHYPTMSLDEICSEPVRDLAADNAHLHLWTTNAFLRDSYDVLDAWGFEFKSCFVCDSPVLSDSVGSRNNGSRRRSARWTRQRNEDGRRTAMSSSKMRYAWLPRKVIPSSQPAKRLAFASSR